MNNHSSQGIIRVTALLASLLVSACTSTPPAQELQAPDSTAAAQADRPDTEPTPREKKPDSDKIPEPVQSTEPSSSVATPIASDTPASITEKTPDLPLKKGPNHFVITVGEKTPTHPVYGKGHKMGFFLDGKAGTPVVLKRGETYEFEIRSDPLHDVYFSADATGWGSSPIFNGVKGQFTYTGIITFTPNETTPNVVYYSCQNHRNMGWKVHIVDKDTPQTEVSRILADANAELQQIGTGTVIKSTGSKSDTKARQKLALAGIMINSAGVKRVMASTNDKAKGMILEARTKLESGSKALDSGKNVKAENLVDTALKLIGAAQRRVPTEAELKEQEALFKSMLVTMEQFEISHKEQYDDTVKKRGLKEAVKYDESRVKELVDNAKGLALNKQYIAANENLKQAEYLITSSIQKMMDKQEIVYKLDIDTPEGEYKYELKKYKSYEELIPIAIEELKPSEGVRKLMDMYVKKGKEQKAAAVAKAKTGDYPVAIAMILSATKQIRRALKAAGVP